VSWASKRQFTYFSIFFGIILIIGAIIIVPAVTKPATCVDGKQNGGELGPDCGGPCQIFCPLQVSDVVVLWSRAFQVQGDRYNIAAYIENQNPNAEIKDIGYEFRLYDQNNKFIGLRDGRTSIPPNGRMAIFEPGINVGNKIPRITSFKFTEAPLWIKTDPAITDRVELTIGNKNLTQTDSAPRLTATVSNTTIYNVPNVEFYGIVYDDADNAIAVSKTFLPSVEKNGTADIFFTWSVPFTGTVFKTEIIPKFDPGAITF
jgi:hypothetical protein